MNLITPDEVFTGDSQRPHFSHPKPRMLFVSCNDFEQAPVNLGASSKVATLIRIFAAMGFEVHYVDSSHLSPCWSRSDCGRSIDVGGTLVTLWRPFRVPNRKVGKVLNVLLARRFFNRIKRVDPALVWVYNGYAFEGALAQLFMAELRTPVVLELEDLPLSRHRGWNPKPYWDQRHFRALLPAAALVTFVNQGLLEAHATQVKRSMLLPSVLRASLARSAHKPRFVERPHLLGYFGGLDREKGAAVLLEVLPHLPGHWQLIVTGAGELTAEFSEAAARFPGRLAFHGTVAQAKLHELMQSCDVIVNPHHSIEAMHNGVFPFKVCEAIAAGALLVSTPVPSIGENMDRAVLFFDGSAAQLLACLDQAAEFQAANGVAIEALRMRVLAQYSEDAIRGRLSVMLEDVFSSLAPPRLAAQHAVQGS